MSENQRRGRSRSFRALALLGGIAFALVVGEGALRVQQALSEDPAQPQLGWVRAPAPPAFAGDCATQPEQAELGDILWPTGELDMVFGLLPNLDTCFRGVRVRTNADGFRTARELAKPKPAEVAARVLLLGDSQAFGWGVSERQTIGAHLRQSLERQGDGPVEVVNAAVPGYNTFQQAALLERQGMAYHPDCVLVVFTANDLALPFFLLKDVAVPARSRSLLLARFEQLAGSKRWFDHASEDLLGYVDETDLERVPEGYRRMVGIDGYRAAWARIVRVAAAVPVVSVGDLSELRPELAAAIEGLHEELGIVHLPLSWPRGQRYQLDPRSDPHPTPTAHRSFARKLAAALAERGVCRGAPTRP